MQIGEIAAASTGDQNLFSDSIGALQHGNLLAGPRRLNGAHQASRTGS